MPDALPVRELYCPAHFGNTYECALAGEMTDLLAEAKHWGFNRYADWFDTIDLYDLYARQSRLFNMPEALWARKFINFRCAADLGYDLGLVVTPNHVFSDQVTPETAAETDGDRRYFGQLVCPNKPGVVEMILGNYRNLFTEFARRGLKLHAVSGGAYDYGGCACEACRPWIVTFGKLFKQIADLAREVFGEIEVSLWGWWWTDEDHEQFTAWADDEARGFFRALAYHLPYGRTNYDLRPVPAGARERAFVHASYGEREAKDSYGHFGPTVAPDRLEKTVAFLRQRRAEGFLAYTEGDCDEINKAILGGLASGQFDTGRAALQAYAERYFGNDPAGWAELLGAMGDYFTLDTPACRARWDKLARDARPSWRLDAVAERLAMAEADAAASSGTDWTPQRLAAAKAYIDAKERLYRRVWRLGLQRHIFQVEVPARMPAWYPEYLQQTGQVVEDRAVEKEA